MSRIFWFLVGVGATVFVVMRGRQVMYRFTPQGVQEQVAEKTQQVAVNLGDFLGILRASMAEREEELRRELNIPAHKN